MNVYEKKLSNCNPKIAYHYDEVGRLRRAENGNWQDDDNKDNLSENDYLHMCNLLKDIYNNHDDPVDIDDYVEISFRQSESIKYFINALVIVSNISTITLLFIFMTKLSTIFHTHINIT